VWCYTLCSIFLGVFVLFVFLCFDFDFDSLLGFVRPIFC
jgi:hypothetical protein